MTHRIKRYGWTPDLPDQRDLSYAAPRAILRSLPAKINLTRYCPPVYDQDNLGSCTANAIAGAIEFEVLKNNRADDFMPSRLFIYYNERAIEQDVDSDAGAQIRDGMKTVNKQGVCSEDTWPYILSRFATKPPAACYQAALHNRVLSYHRINRTLGQMKSCLAGGYPFVFGFTVYESFESAAVARTGKVNMPAPNEKLAGGHAVMAVGYDDLTNRFIVRNSWGKNWGKAGYFTMPYDYLLNENLSDDFWTVSIVETGPAVNKKISKK